MGGKWALETGGVGASQLEQVVKNLPATQGDPDDGSILGLGRNIPEDIAPWLSTSVFWPENMDRGAWLATAYRITKVRQD